ncbi:hypothetical protein [Nonomuraea sp. NPDC049400]|uniref:hypothetical protein n=1 Tax=Nonomuraea sp. NPDC049400 TaxID=3364352 RepID=UPI0037A4992A
MLEQSVALAAGADPAARKAYRVYSTLWGANILFISLSCEVLMSGRPVRSRITAGQTMISALQDSNLRPSD